MKKIKEISKKHLMFGIISCIAFILFVIYMGIAIFFKTHYLFGTTVNGINVSGKNVGEVENLITEEVNGYQIKIIPREGEEEVLKGEDIALKPVFNGTLEMELAKQDEYQWMKSLFQSSEIKTETIVHFEEESLKKLTGNLKLMDKSVMRKAQDAKISDYTVQDGYQIIPEVDGTIIDEPKFLSALESAILGLQDSLSLEEADCYVKPMYTQESEKLQNLADKLNKYAGASITYEFGDSKEVVDGKTISQWLSVKKWKIKISEEKIEEYVASLAEKYNTVGKSKKLASSYNMEVTISGGDYGWKINQEEESKALKEHIKKGEIITKEPAYSKTAGGFGENDYGDTYVEVNLTAQHMFYYKNGELILESDFVSGNESKGWGTPAGAYGLYYKEKDRTLRGEGYATPVSFWMPFNGGVGFHDATWRSSFGGYRYKRGGSHGCVNLPYDVAKNLYDNIEAGCAVLVYQLPGTESAEVKAMEEAEKQAEADAGAVMQAINAIGEVTLDSRPAVDNARSMYNSLNDMARGYVSNLNVLEAAEIYLSQLEAAAADVQAQAEAQPVIDSINQLAGREITLDMKETIEGIRAQYNQLSDAARSKVTNYGILENAEKKIEKLKKEQE